MREYKIHYHIHMGWDTTILADSEDEALEKADEEFGSAPIEDYDYIDDECEVVEVN